MGVADEFNSAVSLPDRADKCPARIVSDPIARGGDPG